MDLHPDICIEKLTIGRERAPLVMIDNFIAEPDRLVTKAAVSQFAPGGRLYPGIRAKAPPSYEHFLATRLQPLLAEHFGVTNKSLSLSMCHYSLVTTPAAQLTLLECLPQVESLAPEGHATIHYLFKEKLGGTAFYGHRARRYEYFDEARGLCIRTHLKRSAPVRIDPFQNTSAATLRCSSRSRAEGVFNRMLVYRRDSLHSRAIDRAFIPDANPRTGRLSINSVMNAGIEGPG